MQYLMFPKLYCNISTHDAEFCMEEKLLGLENCLTLEYDHSSTNNLLYG
jgi:hypothetical protein